MKMWKKMIEGYSRKTAGLSAALVAAALICPLLPLRGQEISSVKFVQPSAAYKFDEDVLKYNISSRKGGVYSEKTLNDDLKRLYALGMFSDVSTETEKDEDGKIKIIFRIMPQSVVEDILFKGNKAYDTKFLTEKLSIIPGQPLNALALQKSANALREFYRSKGLNDATVTVRTENAANGKVRIVFDIAERLRYRVGNVTFKGAKVFPQDELRDIVLTRKSFLSHPWFSWFSLAGLFDREVLSRDKILLREAYLRKGYLDFRVKDIHIGEEKDHPEIVHIEFDVEEGEPYKVGKVSVSGAKQFKEQELLALFGMKSGITYSSDTEKADLRKLENKYYRMGYADLVLHPRLYPNYLKHTVDVEYQIQEGPLYRIHKIFISGNRYTKDHVIRRELPMAPDDPVDNNLVKTAKSRIMGMGLFEKVEAVAIKSDEGELDTKDIDIEVKEKKFIDAKIGGAWSDSDSLAGMIEISHTNVDILDPWNYFTGGGQKLRIMGVAGIDRYGFEVDFTEPWLFGIPLRLDVSGYLRNIVYDDWEDERLGFSVTLTKRIFDDFTAIAAGYTFEHIRIHGMDGGLSEKFTKWKGGDFAGRMHISLTRDTRDSALDPRRGYFVSGLVQFTSQAFGGKHDYIRLEARASYHYSFFHDFLVFSLGGKIGTICTFNGDDVPLYDRYFLGGGDSVRGFPFRSIGPVDENKDNYGGQSMYILTAEISHPIYKNYLRGAAFMDMGGAGASSFGFGKPNIGVGYGLRIKLPNLATPIKLDLAYPVLNQQKGVKNTLRFHFNIGASFSPPL
ncbi:MAG: outer membrane protein assembly factor BamA [Lentisphaeria bacterium]|nr:outer membrane protein assembly factor BamA [Lentisphaeria bacterium]